MGQGPSVLITNHTGQQPHLGCRATCHALERLLMERCAPREIVSERHSQKHNTATMYFGKAGMAVRAARMQHAASYAAYRHADLIVVNGEGSIYSKPWSRNGASSNQRRVDAYLAKKYLGKRVFIVNHTVASNHKRFDAFIQMAYPLMDYIAVREPISYDYLQGLGVTNVQQSADAIFSLEPPAPAQDSPLAGNILVCDSSSWTGWSGPRKKRVQDAVAHLQKQKLNVAYLSIYTDRRDAHFARELGLEYHSFENFADFMAHIQTAAFILSGRFHIGVFAALCAAPFLVFEANTYKTRGLSQLLGHPCPPLDFFRDSFDHIIESVARALAMKDDLRQYLMRQRPRLRELAMKNVPV
jgi:polysaccharide pyruvyl transferase WcaK-like protein